MHLKESHLNLFIIWISPYNLSFLWILILILLIIVKQGPLVLHLSVPWALKIKASLPTSALLCLLCRRRILEIFGPRILVVLLVTERNIEVSNSTHWFLYFSFQFYNFLLHIFYSSVIWCIYSGLLCSLGRLIFL